MHENICPIEYAIKPKVELENFAFLPLANSNNGISLIRQSIYPSDTLLQNYSTIACLHLVLR